MATISSVNDNQEADFHIRPMIIADACSIAKIQNHYIRNTIKTIHYMEYNVLDVETRIRTTLDEKYPAFVAISGLDDQRLEVNDVQTVRTEPRMLGYISTSRFRPQYGWSPTVEVSLFLEPGYERNGVGTALLTLLIKELRDAKRQLDLASNVQDEAFVEIRNGLRYVRQLTAVCVVDEDDLEGFYARRGFKKVAHFENGGYKSGKW